MLEIIPMVLGPLATNAYLVGETVSRKAIVIDPAWDGELIQEEARRRNWQVEQIWITHAHFDHIGGIAGLVDGLAMRPTIALHPADMPLYSIEGGAAFFGFRIVQGPDPDTPIQYGQQLMLGQYAFKVLPTPGHTPGHVAFYCADEKILFCGDVIFQGSIGRTDLPGGNYQTLMHSIYTQILTLPDETRLLPGHGEETTVGAERIDNPFLT